MSCSRSQGSSFGWPRRQHENSPFITSSASARISSLTCAGSDEDTPSPPRKTPGPDHERLQALVGVVVHVLWAAGRKDCFDQYTALRYSPAASQGAEGFAAPPTTQRYRPTSSNVLTLATEGEVRPSKKSCLS